MKWEKLQPPQLDESMCCCQGETPRLSCCREDVDEALNRWLREGPFGGGARPVLGWLMERLELSTGPPLLLLPLLLRVAAWHFLLGLGVLAALPPLLLGYYRATHRRKRRSAFFLSLALYSLAYMYVLFITHILPRGVVTPLQGATATAGMLLTVVLLIHTKRGPGFVTPTPVGAPPQNGSDAPRSGWSWCSVCRVGRPPRAGHCGTCGGCVHRLDHHCVWCRRINSCVGQANHRSFLLTLCVFVLTSVYAIVLVLGTICPQQRPLTALFYCPGVYNHHSTALCFTCCWFCSVITGGLLHLLMVQLLNISCNVTEREVQQALRGRSHSPQTRLFGLGVLTGQHSLGFIHNWGEFLTMKEVSAPPPHRLTHLV